jgi:hypothetical protein
MYLFLKHKCQKFKSEMKEKFLNFNSISASANFHILSCHVYSFYDEKNRSNLGKSEDHNTVAY